MVKKRELGRKIGKRKARKFILIVVEGKETEINYFNSLKQYLKLVTLSIEVVSSKYSDPLSVVNHALFLKQQRQNLSNNTLKLPYDEIYCVFDGDHPNRQNYRDAIAQANKHNLSVIASIPCFEIWFLLHFQYSTQIFHNCDEVGRKLKTYIPHYEKSLNVFPIISIQTKTAIINSEKLFQYHDDLTTQDFPNPSTDAHQLVKKLFEEKDNKKR